ncbi:MAG: helix-turn-helix domain-containing protein [Candidatus Nanopelagicales bacterium]
MTTRFLTLADVAETLNISAAQTYALVRSGDLPAIKIGGRGQWRVESTALEEFIARKYEQTREFVRAHPFGEVPAGEVPAGGGPAGEVPGA